MDGRLPPKGGRLGRPVMPGAGAYVVALACSVPGTVELLVTAAMRGAAAGACALSGLILGGAQLGLIFLLMREQAQRRRARLARRRAQQAQQMQDLALERWVRREASRGLAELHRWLTADRQ